MQHDRFFILVVLLVFSTSFNQAQKLKINDRRSAGLVPYPRIGRNSEMATLPRSERALGMIHQPRIGRSDVSNLGNRFHDLSGDDIELYALHDMDPDILELEYEEYANRPFKHTDKKDGSWLVSMDRGHVYKDLRFPQKIDYGRSYYASRDSRNTQGQGGYTPRLGRETEHDTASFP